MASESISQKLERVLLALIAKQEQRSTALGQTQSCRQCSKKEWIEELDTWGQLETLRRILCERHPGIELPSTIQDDVDQVIAYRNSHTLLTSTSCIIPSATLEDRNFEDANQVRISCWKGDITTLTDVTAIVNAANSRLLGCFVPQHRCIDSVIHSAAGPRLRDSCHSIMLSQRHPEPTGRVKVTPGFQLPAQWILHTVGPQLNSGEVPKPWQQAKLARCYESCLEATEDLAALPDGRKVLVFCCISTGLFAFPSDLAARIAVETVKEWYRSHPKTSITDIIFNTFEEKDQEIYQNLLSQFPTHAAIERLPMISPSPGTIKARAWLKQADTLIITAGAGLSSAAGLDYTSKSLFSKYFPAFRAKGLRQLYDVFGYQEWDSPAEKWGYYFLHLDMVRRWPLSEVYGKLHNLTVRFPGKYFIRTTNADGFFVKNGFDEDVISTPQGQYRFLQCFDKCREDAYTLSEPFVDAALPFIDSKTQVLMDASKIPKCRFCGGEVTLCVRGGGYFNSEPFRDQEIKWNMFLRGLEKDGTDSLEDISPSTSCGRVVLLELGVGLNTPGVLRWPNEDLVSGSKNKDFRLIRVGKEASGCVPWELEEEDLAVGIDGDILAALNLMITETPTLSNSYTSGDNAAD